MEKKFTPFVDAGVVGFKNAIDALLYLSSFFHYFAFENLSGAYRIDLNQTFDFMLEESKRFRNSKSSMVPEELVDC
jgi:hypothetical protein